MRALGLDIKPDLVNRTLADLGEPMWNPPSPQGFKDDVATWLAPDAMSTRVDVAQLLAAQDKSLGDPLALGTDLHGRCAFIRHPDGHQPRREPAAGDRDRA